MTTSEKKKLTVSKKLDQITKRMRYYFKQIIPELQILGLTDQGSDLTWVRATVHAICPHVGPLSGGFLGACGLYPSSSRKQSVRYELGGDILASPSLLEMQITSIFEGCKRL